MPDEICWKDWRWWFHYSNLAEFSVYLHVAGIGPFRWHWYSEDKAPNHDDV